MVCAGDNQEGDVSLIIESVNEHAALLAVEKAAEKYLHAGDSVDLHGDKLEQALARLARVRKG